MWISGGMRERERGRGGGETKNSKTISTVDFVADNYHDQLARVLKLIYEILITQCLYICVFLEAQFNEN